MVLPGIVLLLEVVAGKTSSEKVCWSGQTANVWNRLILVLLLELNLSSDVRAFDELEQKLGI